MSYDNYVNRRATTFVDQETPEEFLMHGLYILRQRIAMACADRKRMQDELSHVETSLISLEQQERSYVERMTAMWVKP